MDINKEIEKYNLKCSLLGIEPMKIYTESGFVLAELINFKAVDCIVPNFVDILGENAFLICRQLARVVLPNSLKEIHTDAFTGCSSLRDITIPVNVKIIKEYAFMRCRALKVVTIESSDIVIKDGAFYKCKNISTINIRGRNIKLESNAFKHCNETNGIEEVNIECERLDLGVGVFDNCKKIKAPKRLKEVLAEYGDKVELY